MSQISRFVFPFLLRHFECHTIGTRVYKWMDVTKDILRQVSHSEAKLENILAALQLFKQFADRRAGLKRIYCWYQQPVTGGEVDAFRQEVVRRTEMFPPTLEVGFMVLSAMDRLFNDKDMRELLDRWGLVLARTITRSNNNEPESNNEITVISGDIIGDLLYIYTANDFPHPELLRVICQSLTHMQKPLLQNVNNSIAVLHMFHSLCSLSAKKDDHKGEIEEAIQVLAINLQAHVTQWSFFELWGVFTAFTKAPFARTGKGSVGLDAAINRLIDLCLNETDSGESAISNEQIDSVISMLIQHNLHDTSSFANLAGLARKRGLHVDEPEKHETVNFE